MTTSRTLGNGKPNTGRPRNAFRALMTGLVVALAGGGVTAAEIAFDGGEDGSGTDLSLAANWAGDTLPTDADVATVNCATWPNLTLGGDLALGGLTLSGATGAVTLDGAGKLTLGATGLKFDAAQTFNLKAPVAIATAQTWGFMQGAVNSYAKISGTADLTWTDQGAVSFYVAPEYGGSFTCIGRGVRHYTTGKVAAKFTSKLGGGGSDSEKCYDYIAFQGVASFSDLVSDGSYTSRGWRRTAITVPSTGATNYPTLKIDRDTDVYDAEGPYRLGLANGVVDHSAGEIKTLNYGIALGMHEGLSQAGMATPNTKLWPCLWQMSGSALYTGSYIFIGESAQNVTTNFPRFVQKGGTAKVTKCLAIGTASNASTYSLAEYLHEGGALDVSVSKNVGSDHQTRGIVLCHPFGGASSQPGVFTQTGGETLAYGVKFGPDTGAWNSNPASVNSGFGLLSLWGGSLTLAANGSGIGFGKGWNTTDLASSYYRIVHGGGALVSQRSHVVPTGINIAPGETPAEWNTEANHVTVAGPVSGNGTLRKTGAGRLTLTDTKRFVGTLKVDEGEVCVSGGSSPVSTNENCWVWTADSLAGDYAHGQCVSNWVDHNHGLAAKDWVSAGTIAATASDSNYGKDKHYMGAVPTFNTNMTFNGHATLWFDKAVLAISPTENPLVDSTNFTIAVAYRPNYFGGNAMVWYGGTILGGGDHDYSCDVPILNAWTGNGRAMFGALCYPDGNNRTEAKLFSREGRSLAQSVHVAVMTVKGLDLTLVTDGGVTNQNFAKTWNYRKMFRSTNKKAMAFYFGGHFPDYLNFAYCPAYIAEVRIYKDRSLAVGEQQAIAAELLTKYRADGVNEYLAEHTGPFYDALAEEPDLVDPVPCAQEWTADAANDAADGSEITSWNNTSNTVAATVEVGQGLKGPTLVKNAVNGHSFLRFAATEKTALGVAKSQLPVYGGNFAYAVVFRTRSAPVTRWGSYAKDSGEGLFTTDLSTGNCHVGFTWQPEGIILAGYAWSSVFAYTKPCRLNDGLPHVAIFSRSATKEWVLNIDGVAYAGTTTDGNSATQLPMLIGRIATGQDTGYFTGDIAAMRFYGRKLTADEAASLADYYGAKYGFAMNAKRGSSVGLAQNRLGATNVTVAAGAKLMLPTSADRASVTFGAGETLDLAGAIGGSIALADGATLKVDCTAGVADIDRLVASGSVRLDVRGASAKRPRWLPLVRLGSYDFTGVNWVFDDGGYDTKIEVRDGVLGLVTRHGMMLILR